MKPITIIIFMILSFNCFGDEVLTPKNCENAQSDELVADCIESGVWNPCENIMGSKSVGDCQSGRRIVAERRMQRAIKKLNGKSIGKHSSPNDQYSLEWSQSSWKLYRDQYCYYMHDLSRYKDLFRAQNIVDCIADISEKRADELEYLLNESNQALKAQPSAAGTPQSGAP